MYFLKTFWETYPALFYGLILLLGVVLGLSHRLDLLIPLSLLLLFSGSRQRLLLALALCATGYAYTALCYNHIELPEKGIRGKAHIKIESLSSSSTHFGKRWLYRGWIERFESPELKITTSIPFKLSLPQNLETMRPPANQGYLVEGQLKKSSSGEYHLSVGRHTPWYPIKGSWSFAEWRYTMKKRVSQYIMERIHSPKAATFLTGIATGEFDDRLMQNQFGRFGLQHIMAISGFHFSIVALFLSFLLRLVFKRKTALLFLIILLTSYFLFLGSTASVMRAWVTAVIGLAALWLQREGNGLNSLGVALLVVLLVDPLQSLSLGFQFSFAVTAAILLFYPLCERFFQKIFLLRPLAEVVEMSGITQHAYCILSFFRSALSMTLAVNLIALPITLYYFQKFPVLSLVHNLFFPFLVSISMVLLLLAALADLILPPLGMLLHMLNRTYTGAILNFTYKVPSRLDLVWYSEVFSFPLLILYLTGIFTAALMVKWHLNVREEKGLIFPC